MSVLGVVIPAIASLLAGGLSSIGQSKTNENLIKENEKSRKWQEGMYDKQKQFAWDMFHATNSHNTPEQQAERFRRAGINPALALGNITPGIAQAQSAGAAPSGSVPQLQNPMQGLSEGVHNAGQAYMEGRRFQEIEKEKVSFEKALAVVNKENVELNNQNMAKVNKRLDEFQDLQIEYQKKFNAKLDAEIYAMNQLTDAQREQLQAQSAKIKADTKLVEIQQALADDELKHLRPLQRKQISAQIANIGTATALYSSQIGLTKNQAELAMAQRTKTYLEAQGIHINNKTLERMNNAALRELEGKGALIYSQLEYVDFDKMCQGINTISNFIGAVASAAPGF